MSILPVNQVNSLVRVYRENLQIYKEFVPLSPSRCCIATHDVVNYISYFHPQNIFTQLETLIVVVLPNVKK